MGTWCMIAQMETLERQERGPAPWRQGLVNMAAARPRAWSAEPDFHADRGPDGQVLIIVINLDHPAYKIVKPAIAVLTGLRFSFS